MTFDSSFGTVQKSDTHSDWLLKTGFVSQRETEDSTRKKGKNPNVPQLEIEGNEESKQQTRNEVQNPETPGKRKRKRQERTLSDKALSPESRRLRESAAASAGTNLAASPDESGTSREAQGQVIRTRSGRKTKPVTRLLSIMAAEIGRITAGDVLGEIFCFLAMFPEGDHQEYNDPLLAYKEAVSDPDTLYYTTRR